MERTAKKELFLASVITLIMTFMNITGLPAVLFVNVQILDIQPFYFSLMVNFALTAVVFYVGWKLFFPNWSFGLGLAGFRSGIKQYGLSGIVIFDVSSLAFCVGLLPFDYQPTVFKVLVESFFYYIGVAVIEELYIRALLLNILKKLFQSSKHAVPCAVILSAVIFGLGHIFGTLGSPLLTIVCKVIWTIALGLYVGAIYVATKSLWVPIALHAVIDFCAWPFSFSTQPPYPEVSLWILLIVYVLVGGYGLRILFRRARDAMR